MLREDEPTLWLNSLNDSIPRRRKQNTPSKRNSSFERSLGLVFVCSGRDKNSCKPSTSVRLHQGTWKNRFSQDRYVLLQLTITRVHGVLFSDI